MITFEDTGETMLEIFMDAEGRDYLIAILTKLRVAPDHQHLMTESWGAGEVDQMVHDPANKIFNMVTIRLLAE